jgi:tRNA(Phe) wybutosine-synthesizing methylase Tyw3
MDKIKSVVLRKLEEAVSSGLVDEELIPLLNFINSFDGMVSTSSCSGRYQLISVPITGDKLRAKVIGKWHRTIEISEMVEAIGSWDGSGELHLLVQPLLIHIRTIDIKTGAKIRKIGQESGLKFSTIRSVKLDSEDEVPPWGVVVEMLGTERMEIPLTGIDEKLLTICLGPWVEKGNELITRTKSHIGDLMTRLEEGF